MDNPKLAVIGLGYVGLPLALALAEKFPDTVGFDIDDSLIDDLGKAVDRFGLGLEQTLGSTSLKFSSDPGVLSGCNFFIVTVPTPVNENNKPDLEALRMASETVAACLSKGAIVVFESTVYPGVTEEVCAPILEQVSGLKRGVDFKLGYSPERINPGDTTHTLESVIKIISAEDEETLAEMEAVYSKVVKAGLHKAPSIRVAEAAKAIENVQRDLNIALMNELALIFDRLNISTKDVLEAAGTKWNFLKFTPGLVGGHCIGVDPYYLTTKAEHVGYIPQVILAGRRINNEMGTFLAQRTVKLMVNSGLLIKGACVGILGVAFKENVPDTRNSRVPDIVSELKKFGANPVVYDPLVNPEWVREELGITLCNESAVNNVDALILAVPHESFLQEGLEKLTARIKKGGIFVDVKSLFHGAKIRDDLTYWSF